VEKHITSIIKYNAHWPDRKLEERVGLYKLLRQAFEHIWDDRMAAALLALLEAPGVGEPSAAAFAGASSSARRDDERRGFLEKAEDEGMPGAYGSSGPGGSVAPGAGLPGARREIWKCGDWVSPPGGPAVFGELQPGVHLQ